jgi:hypothetical protein
MKSRYIFDKVNQDITASITREMEKSPRVRDAQPTYDDLICALIFIVLVVFMTFLWGDHAQTIANPDYPN